MTKDVVGDALERKDLQRSLKTAQRILDRNTLPKRDADALRKALDEFAAMGGLLPFQTFVRIL